MDGTIVASTLSIADIKAQFLKEALDVLQTTKEGALKGLEYLSSQIPDIIKQFLNWELAIGIICLVIGIALVITMWCLANIVKRSYITNERNWDYVPGTMIAPLVGAIFSGLAGFSFVIANIIKITQILVAPKIFLIQYILANVR